MPIYSRQSRVSTTFSSLHSPLLRRSALRRFLLLCCNLRLFLHSAFKPCQPNRSPKLFLHLQSERHLQVNFTNPEALSAAAVLVALSAELQSEAFSSPEVRTALAGVAAPKHY
jgi:hypothetical protein